MAPAASRNRGDREKAAGHRCDAGNHGQGVELIRHTFIVPADGDTEQRDEQRELWQVASDFWAMGEDGEYEESYTLHPGETAARAAYDAEVTRINRVAR